MLKEGKNQEFRKHEEVLGWVKDAYRCTPIPDRKHHGDTETRSGRFQYYLPCPLFVLSCLRGKHKLLIREI